MTARSSVTRERPPLASIFGSGFLVIVPVLNATVDPTPWSPWLRCALGVVHRRAGVDGLSHLCHRPLPATASGAVKWRTRLAKNEVPATVLREGSHTQAGYLSGLG